MTAYIAILKQNLKFALTPNRRLPPRGGRIMGEGNLKISQILHG